MSLSDDSVVFAATEVVPVPDVLVVTAPPFNATVPPPLMERFVLTGCVNVKLPPVPVDRVAVKPDPGPAIAILLAPPLMVNVELPVACSVGVVVFISPCRV